MANLNQLIKAVQTATRKLASTAHFDEVLKDVLSICVEAVEASGGTIYLHDSGAKTLVFRHVLPVWVKEKLPSLDIKDDYGVAGEAFQERHTVLKTFPNKPASDRNPFEIATGVNVQSIIAVPLMLENEDPIGVVQLINKKNGTFTDADIVILDIISSVSTLAFYNHRLTEESARASSLLGMGKVSHDIGNLAAALYANISFTEMSMDDLNQLASSQNDIQLRAIVDTFQALNGELKNSIERIVGYSRLISDMSAGRKLRPNKTSSSLGTTIKTAASFLESEARSKHIQLIYKIEQDLTGYPHDETFVFRITQNLVGNAIKAVQEIIPDEWLEKIGDNESAYFGEVTISYGYDSTNHWLEVSDTGPGMDKERVKRILHGQARSQWDKGAGSGWGMKIVLDLAKSLDAIVEIDSKVGEGSIFRIIFPIVNMQEINSENSVTGASTS